MNRKLLWIEGARETRTSEERKREREWKRNTREIHLSVLGYGYSFLINDERQVDNRKENSR